MKIMPLNPQNDQLSIGLLAQLVEPCTDITEVMSSHKPMSFTEALYHYCYLTLMIRPVTRKGYGSIAHEAKPNGLLTRGP